MTENIKKYDGGKMKKTFSFLAVMLLVSATAFTQTTNTALNGTVSGPDGLIPGATVVVRDNKTAQEVTTVTNEEGSFRVPNLNIGAYTVTVTANGFKTFTANEVVLEVGKEYSLPVTLELGVVSEVVNVTAGTEIVNSVDAEITNSVSRKQLDDLPSLGRNPLNFVPLQAGAASNPSQLTVINGIRTSATNTTIDGINVQDNFIRSNATDFSPARPTVDEVEEFAVSTQTGADDGFGGAQIQFATRRGSNTFNVRLFEFNRNSELAANNFFDNANRVRRPFRNRNQFGGNVGGPILKDKLFFFFSYEKLIDRQPAAAQNNTVLTANARQGLFTYTALANDPANGIVAGQLVTVNILNPVLATGITAVNPIIQSRFLANLPTGNNTLVGDQRNTTGFTVIQNFNQEQYNYATRIDYVLNPTNTVTGTFRYVRQEVNRADAGIDDSFNTDPRVTQPSINPFLSLGWNSAISSNFSNELRGGFFFSEPVFLRKDANLANFVIPTLVSNPEVTFQNQGRIVDTYNIQDNANYIWGNHSFRFGGQFQKVKIDAFNDAGIVPTYTLGTNVNTPQLTTAQFTNTSLFPGQVPTAQRATANALLALLGGIVSSGAQTFNVTSQTSGFVPNATQSRQFEYNILGLHFADQWRVRNDLTVNLGLRYDYYTALKSLNGLFLEPKLNDIDNPLSSLLDPNGVYQFIGGNAGKANTFYRPDKNNLAPVISFAYAPTFGDGFGKLLFGEKFVIRGGYRISYINDELVRAPDNALGGNQGLQFASNVINPATGTTALNARIDTLPAVPAPVFSATRTYAQNNAAAGLFGTVFAVDPKIKSPLVHEYSFGFQREVGFDTAIEVRYVGTRSNNLIRGIDFNQVDIFNNRFNDDFNIARSNLVINQAERTRRINALVAGGLTPAAATTQVNNELPESAAFNAALTGSRALIGVFSQLAGGGLIGTAPGTGQTAINGTIAAGILAGTPADLAITYVVNNLAGGVRFLPNPNAGVVDLLTNGSKFNYNALQIDVRRRFTQGLALNANYTFSKNLTDAQGTGQTRFEPLLDNNNPDLENSRADYDQTHKFNLLASYELPFGKGRRFSSGNNIVDFLAGGFQIGAIFQIGSGAPITFTDARGTLNRAARSARQTAFTNLTKAELKRLVGIYRTPNGVFFLPPEVLGRNADGTLNAAVGGTGRGANGFGQPAFAGQIFFNNAPGTTSGLERAVVNGPTTTNLDLSLIKRFRIGERVGIQLQGDLFNALNTVNFIPGQFLDINGTNFGRITATTQARITQLAFRIEF